MKPWTRDDTKDWIHQVENRIEDLQYYIDRTFQWCKDNEVYSEKLILILNFMTCIWVSHMRQEPISFVELLEFLDLNQLADQGQDKIYELSPILSNVDHDELLEILVKDYDNDQSFPS